MKEIESEQKRVPPLYEIEAMNQTYLEPFSSVCVPGYRYNLCGGCGDKTKGAAVRGSTVRCALRTFSLDSARAHAPSKQPFLFARKNPLLFQTGGQFREGK